MLQVRTSVACTTTHLGVMRHSSSQGIIAGKAGALTVRRGEPRTVAFEVLVLRFNIPPLPPALQTMCVSQSTGDNQLEHRSYSNVGWQACRYNVRAKARHLETEPTPEGTMKESAGVV